MTKGSSVLERWSDRIHPMIVKELRQSVRSGTVMWLMLGGGLVFVGALLFQLWRNGGEVRIDQTVGRSLFLVLVNLLFLQALFLVAVSAANRILTEREPGAIDLLYTTPLTAPSIIGAKLFCGLYETLLLFSIALPALFLATLLRGVDVLTVISSLLLAIPLLLGPLQGVIFIGSLRVSRAVKGILMVVGLGVAVPVCLGIYSACVMSMVNGGIFRLLGVVFTGNGIGVIGIYVAVVGVMHGISCALVATPGGGLPYYPEVKPVEGGARYHF